MTRAFRENSEFSELENKVLSRISGGKWAEPELGRQGVTSTSSLPALRFAKKGKPSFSTPQIHRQNLTISLAAPTECASICFAIFPGGVSEPKGKFSTLSA